jgi:hypothetical protein
MSSPLILIIRYLMLLFSLLVLFSCKKGDVIVDPPEKPVNGRETIRPVGQPIGEMYSEFVGADGGIVKSPDGRLAINIPAGALMNETEIGIQPLKNTAVSGVGYSYRLTPHGTAFKKKVTVSFSYKNDVRRLSSEKAVEVAYQDEKGVWTCIGGAVNDAVKKTISVQTDHFSDWSFVESMELSPVVKTVHVSESVTLKALRYVHPSDGEDFLVPLSSPKAGTGEPVALDPKYIVRWTLNGPGKLVTSGNEGVYTAPATKPATKTATVSVQLNVNGAQVLLISTITIVDDGIDISIDGGPWKNYAGIASKPLDANRVGFVNYRTSNDLPQIICLWPKQGAKADGIYSWTQFNDEASHVIFQYAAPDFKRTYTSAFADQENEIQDSGGFIEVEEIEQNGKKYITGMFVIESAGIIDMATAEQVGTGSITGTFKLQRVW